MQSATIVAGPGTVRPALAAREGCQANLAR
jgi:hypothetical protein